MDKGKNLEEYVVFAKRAVRDLLTGSKDDVRERIASKILESEGYLRVKPDNLTLQKRMTINLDGKMAAAVLSRMGKVFGGGPTDLKEVHLGAVEEEFKALEAVPREPEGRPRRLVDLILEEMDEKEESSDERGEAERVSVPVEAPAGAQGAAGDGPGAGKARRKRKKVSG